MSEPATTDDKPTGEGEKPVVEGDKPAVEADEPAAEPSAVSSDGAPVKKKKKKKKKSAEAPKEELDAEGRERPTFVLAFPSDPALDHAVKAFELGDYAAVREEATKLVEHPNKEIRSAAGELLRRIEPDPLVKVLLAMAILLLLVVTVWAYRTHGH